MAPRLRQLFNAVFFTTFFVPGGYGKSEHDHKMGGIHTKLPGNLTEVDVIIAGGGTAGCVLASRLSDAHPDLSVLVIERGHDNVDNNAVSEPLYWLTNVIPGSPRILSYHGASEPQLGGRELDILTGSILGGGSSINVMGYSRAQGQGMDDWNIPGWAAKDLLPYMQKIETYHGEVNGSSDTHGHDGPLQITPHGKFGPTRLQAEMIDAAHKLGYQEAVDLQNLDSINSFQRMHRYISRDGIRQDAAHAYLHPRLQDGKHPNLHVLTEHHVLRVLTENGKATGVEFIPTPEHTSESHSENDTKRVRAKRMVVVTAGNFGSPLILERSGVGDPEVLAKAGIDTVVDLPGVGTNIRDHAGFFTSYLSALPRSETYNGIFDGSQSLDSMLAHNSSKLSWNGYEVTSKLRPSEKELGEMSPAFQAAWERDFKESPTKVAGMVTTYTGYFNGNLPNTSHEVFSVASFSCNPYSRGSIHATGPSFADTPRLLSGYLSDSEGLDTQVLVWLYKLSREIVRRMPLFRGEYCPDHPSFPHGSDAACITVDQPLAEDMPNVKYTDADNKAIEEWARRIVTTNSHSVGTCKMGSRDDQGVLDANLNVHGLKGLKVADLSIAPHGVSSNTANLAFTIGEKAADIVIGELHT